MIKGSLRPERTDEHHRDHHFEIKIDHVQYTVTMSQMTGRQLRDVAKPPIGPTFDLFEVVPGGSDRKIRDEEVVEIRNGLSFVTAPVQVHFEIQIDRHHYTVTLRADDRPATAPCPDAARLGRPSIFSK